MAGQGQFDHIVEGGEIENFLKDFVAPKDGSAPHMPKDTDAVLKDVKAIWEEKGLLSPAELRAELVTKYMPAGTPQSVIDFARDTELSRNAPEATTGYLNKEHAYLASSLAHLYAVEMDRPVAHMESDASNMGGTNVFFMDLLRREAEAKGLQRSEADIRKEAEGMTDKAVLLLCTGIAADIARECPEAKVIPIRTGGDEFRLHFDGVDPSRFPAITEMVHESIERHVAAMGLQDHHHLKAPDKAVRNGFGIAMTTIDMRDIDNPHGLIEELDSKIKNVKDHLGHIRLGVIDEEIERAEIKAALRHGHIKPPEGMSEKDFIESELTRRQDAAQLSSENLHALNPMHNGQGLTAAVFNAYAAAKLAEYGAQSPIVSAVLPPALARSLIGENRPDGVEPLASMETRRMAAALQDFEGNGIELTAAQKHLIGVSVAGLTQRDPSAQTLMPAEMARNMDILAAESGAYAKLHNLPATAEPQALAVSLHGLAALNGAFGHHTADIGLRHMGNDIIKGALHDVGLPKTDPPPFEIAHHGGGNFTVAARPGAGIDDKTAQKVNDAVLARTKDFNETPVIDFLRAKGVEVTPEFERGLKDQGIKTFADLKDSKEREVKHEGQTLKASVDGIHAAVAAAKIDGPASGVIGVIRRDADAKMDGVRRAIVIDRAAPKKQPDTFLNTRFTQQMSPGIAPAMPPPSIAPAQSIARKSQPPKPAA